jgi:hypothetical protein
MSKYMTLADLIEALEDFVDEYPGIENFPVVLAGEPAGALDEFLLTSVDTDGENIMLGFEEQE